MSDRTASTEGLARAANEGIQMLVATFDKRAHEFQTRLPSTISLESFRDAFITAVTGNKRLLDADTSSLFLALQKCADAGLKPDGQEAVITIFGDDREEGGRMVASNANKKKQAVFMPMVWGLVKLIKNAGGVKTVTAELVYKGEPCKIILGDEPRFEHERVLDLDYSNAPIIGAYAIVSYLDGAIEREWMNKYELDRVAAVNPSTKGPRSKWPDQMHRKGPLRRLSKRLRKSKELERLDAALDQDDAKEIDGDVVETSPMPPSRGLSAPSRSTQRQEQGIAEPPPPEDFSDRQSARADANNARNGAGSPGDDAKPAAPVLTRPPQTSGVTSSGGEKPDTFLVYATDEFGEPVMQGTEFQTFTTPLAFVTWLELAASKSANVTALLEHNADAIDEALRADSSLNLRVDGLVLKGDTPPKKVGTPQPIPAPAKPGPKGWAEYLEAARSEIRALESPEAMEQWKDRNLGVYAGNTVEIGVNKALAEQSLKFPQPDRDAVQAEGFIADIKACKTRDALTTYAANGALRTVMARWKTQRPELFEKVDRASEDKLAEFGGSA